MKYLKIISVLLAAVLSLFYCTAANAEELSDGSVEGLPERLVVLDESGNSVSDSGEYFFIVDDMQQGTEYTKNIQIMNMRDDAAYKVLFRAEPVSSSGSIDLANECECIITVDGKELYTGKVTGEGTPDIRGNTLDLGVYDSGQSRNMTVSITWNGSSAGGFIDYGERIVTHSGTEIVREKSGDNIISGETEFKWIFSAETVPLSGSDSSEKTNSSSSSSEKTNSNSNSSNGMVKAITTGEKIAVLLIVVIMLASLVMVILFIGKKKRHT